jgi:hypothetical protein
MREPRMPPNFKIVGGWGEVIKRGSANSLSSYLMPKLH